VVYNGGGVRYLCFRYILRPCIHVNDCPHVSTFSFLLLFDKIAVSSITPDLKSFDSLKKLELFEILFFSFQTEINQQRDCGSCGRTGVS
jgi:hypothetical protein